MTISFRDKHVLITGGSEGIGLALAQQFLSDGALTTLLARSLEKLQNAQSVLKVLCASVIVLDASLVFVECRMHRACALAHDRRCHSALESKCTQAPCDNESTL